MQIVSSHIRADSGTFCIFLADHYSPFYYSIIKQGIKPGSKHRFSSVHTSGRFLLSFIRKKCQQTELFIVQARPPPCQICFSKSNLINEVSTMKGNRKFYSALHGEVHEVSREVYQAYYQGRRKSFLVAQLAYHISTGQALCCRALGIPS